MRDDVKRSVLYQDSLSRVVLVRGLTKDSVDVFLEADYGCDAMGERRWRAIPLHDGIEPVATTFISTIKHLCDHVEQLTIAKAGLERLLIEGKDSDV